jgi:ATP-dependent exoDNAse (exonuclease V) beta subunit
MARRVQVRWARLQQEENVRDYDSMILDARSLLQGEAGAAALASIRERIRLLIIDEFQDTDAAQRDIGFAIAGLLAGDAAGVEPPQLFLVGDAKQSLYRFRHADISVWNSAKQVLHGKKKPLELTHNFRSDPKIVDFANRICGPVMTGVGDALMAHSPESVVEYAQLHAHRAASSGAEVEWLQVNGLKWGSRREREGELVAARIRQLVDDGVAITDPDGDDKETRSCGYRDMAVLFRTRTGIEEYEKALHDCGVPYYLTGGAGLTERQEIVDLLTVLRLVENRRDNLHAFAYLRSPFVGLRDEVIARMRLEHRSLPLLGAARRYLDSGEWYAAKEHADIVEIEKKALRAGLDAIDEMSELRSRQPIDHLLEEVLDRTGYRLHLMLSDQPEPKLANIQRFLRLLQGYRNHTVGTFLEIWDRWESQDLGIPQAPLYSKDDDVVTLSTIHSAKGLEWPVVFLVDNDNGFTDKLTNEYWSDRALGPILCPKQDDRGHRAERLHARASAEDHAEAARVLYVAVTRARDRLIVAGPTESASGVGEWLSRGLPGEGETDYELPITSEPAEVSGSGLRPEPQLSWLDDIAASEEPLPLVAPIRLGRRRWIRSATELMAHQRSRREWQLKYWHGVEPPWYFAPESESEDEIPPWVRGVVIHGVLEKLQTEAELADLLEEAIGALDSPELEERMAAGTEYRVALEDEIARVVQSDEWKWYTEGENHRELAFAHLVNTRKWRTGAFDLFVPRDDENWIIDFKTHVIGAERVEEVARGYRRQALVYGEAARALFGDARMRFHFTHPNVAVD